LAQSFDYHSHGIGKLQQALTPATLTILFKKNMERKRPHTKKCKYSKREFCVNYQIFENTLIKNGTTFIPTLSDLKKIEIGLMTFMIRF